jgi:hypothetical protein
MGWDPKKTAGEIAGPGAIKDRDAPLLTQVATNPSGAVKTVGGNVSDIYHKQIAGNIGGDISNAYHTSIVDPLKKAGSTVQDFLHGFGGPGGGVGGMGGFGGPGSGVLQPGSQAQMVVGPLGNPAGNVVQLSGMDPAFKSAQLALINQLNGQAMGTGPSIAENQLRSAQEANLAQTIALANSARGASQPAIARAALEANAQTQGQLAQQAATARLQEQMQAAGLLGDIAGQGRGQDITVAQTNADLKIKHDDLVKQYVAMGIDVQKANQAADIEMKKLIQTGAIDTQKLGIDAQKNTILAAGQNQNFLGNMFKGAGGFAGAFGTIFGGGGDPGAPADDGATIPDEFTFQGGSGSGGSVSAGGNTDSTSSRPGSKLMPTEYSDARLKEDVTDGDPSIRAFLDSLGSHEYAYKDPKHGEGRFVSPMAQELLQTPLGASMVEDGEDGLQVNYGRGFGALLAAQASLNKRLAKLEKK